MGKTIAIANQKGGVGKTTTCTSICCALKNRGRRVLLVDADPQGNCTSGMGVDKSASPNIYDILVNGAAATDCVVETKYGDVIPANKELSGATVELVGAEKREFVLKSALDGLKDSYDYIFIDCPPSLELLTLNALVAADTVLVPVQCEYYALEGIADLMTTIKLTNKRLNSGLSIEGIVLTMYDSRTNFSNQVADEIRKFFGDKVYKTMIPRNVRLAEAPSHGKPVIAYDRLSKGSRAYLKLANEFLKRQD
ncbi:MAG: ParA family protein [Candidatus Heteroscillospira sp.]|jgi:chromosome partitioning protein